MSSLKSALALVVLSLAATAAPAQSISKEGVPFNEVNNCVMDFRSNGYMPVYIKGYPGGGTIRYDLVFEPQRAGVQWEVRYNLSEADWQQKSSDYASLGYSRPCSNPYIYRGVRYHATLWVKNNN